MNHDLAVTLRRYIGAGSFFMLQNACVPKVMLTVSGYDPARGAVIQA